MDTASREQGSRLAVVWACSSQVGLLSFLKGQARRPRLMRCKVPHEGPRIPNAHHHNPYVPR